MLRRFARRPAIGHPVELVWRDGDDAAQPFAAFVGARRTLMEAPVRVTLRTGTLRTVTLAKPVHEVSLAGPADAVRALALELAAMPGVAARLGSLAEAARRLASRELTDAPSGMPPLAADQPVGDACREVIAHLAVQIARAGALIAADTAPIPADPEPVHQMRVAVRRLRSMLALFRGALAGPGFDDAAMALKPLGAILGPARDWDVFVGGTGRRLAEAYPEEPAARRLLAAARRRQQESYAALRAFLAAPDYRCLGIELACLVGAPPWQQPEQQPEQQPGQQPGQQAQDPGAMDPPPAWAAPLGGFARHALSRRLRRLRAPGADIATLPDAELHAIRLRAKRMRYAAEHFAPLFGKHAPRRFIRRVAALQEALGHLNDGAVAAGLMAQLGPAIGHGFAGGIVRGLVIADAPQTRQMIAHAWRRLREIEPFWD